MRTEDFLLKNGKGFNTPLFIEDALATCILPFYQMKGNTVEFIFPGYAVITYHKDSEDRLGSEDVFFLRTKKRFTFDYEWKQNSSVNYRIRESIAKIDYIYSEVLSLAKKRLIEFYTDEYDEDLLFEFITKIVEAIEYEVYEESYDSEKEGIEKYPYSKGILDFFRLAKDIYLDIIDDRLKKIMIDICMGLYCEELEEQEAILASIGDQQYAEWAGK